VTDRPARPGGSNIGHNFGRSILRRVRSAHVLYGFVVALIAFGAAMVVAGYVGAKTSCAVSAQTEYLQLTIRDQLGVEALLPRVWGPDTPSVRWPQKHAALRAEDGTILEMRRMRGGDLLLTVDWDPAAKRKGASLKVDRQEIALEPGTTLRISLDAAPAADGAVGEPETLVIGFRGDLVVGHDATPLVQGTLLSGQVTVFGKTPFLGERYVLHNETLAVGDVPSWRFPDDAAESKVEGLIHVGAQDAMQVSASAAAKSILVDRRGAAAYEISSSVWDFVKNAPLVNWGLTMLAAVVSLAGLFNAHAEFKNRHQAARNIREDH